MEFLQVLEKIRSPFLDRVMLLVTEMGGEVFLIGIGMILLWCVDKRLGRLMLCAGSAGIVASQWLKILCRVPRPWVRLEGFTIVEAAREGAGGYSFPSGHSQSAAAVFFSAAAWVKKPVVRAVCLCLTALVMFSRMYLGVHTPADVLVGCALSAVFVGAYFPFFRDGSGKKARAMLAGTAVFSAAYMLFISLYPFGGDVDAGNLNEGIQNAWTVLGTSLGLWAAFEMDEKAVRYDPKAVWYVQVLKCVLGLCLVMALRVLLKQPPLSLFGGHPAASAVRYGLLCVFAGGIWPMAFPYLGRIGRRTEAKER